MLLRAGMRRLSTKLVLRSPWRQEAVTVLARRRQGVLQKLGWSYLQQHRFRSGSCGSTKASEQHVQEGEAKSLKQSTLSKQSAGSLAAADFAVLWEQRKLPTLEQPLTTGNSSSGNELPALLKFEAKLGPACVTADSSGRRAAELELCRAEETAEVGVAFGPVSLGGGVSHETTVKGTWSSEDSFGLTSESMMQVKVTGGFSEDDGFSLSTSTEEAGLVSGHINIDADGNVSGGLQFDQKAIAEFFNDSQQGLSVEQLQLRWGEHLMEGRITVNGADVSLKYQEFNVSGNTEISRVDYGEDGSVRHYYGETEVREGTVEQLMVGLGVHAPGDVASVKGEAAILSQNDYTSHKETHTFDNCGNSTTETFTTSDTIDKSTEVLGVKVAGTTETSRKETTINTEQTEGTFISSTKKTTTEEEIHLKEHHNILSDDVEILHESRFQVEELEYQLTQAGFAGLACLIKPAMALYLADGTLSSTELSKIALQTLAASAAMACFSKIVGSQNAIMAVVLIATVLPDLAHGRTDEVKLRLQKLMLSMCLSAAANRSTQICVAATPLAPVAPIMGAAAGMCASSMAGHFCLDELLERLRKLRAERPLGLAA